VKITGHVFSDYQITSARKYLECRPARGGKRPIGQKRRSATVIVRRRK
jgi:hypothetical protein